MKRKKLPSFVTNPLLVEFFQTRAGRVLSNWLFQGMLYMNPVEIAYKVMLDVVIAVALLLAFSAAPDAAAAIVALLVAHTINWIINGQPVALLMHMDIGRNDPQRFIGYIEKLERRIRGRSYVAAAASYGSLSKGNYKDTSDIDIRFIMRNSLWQKIRAAHYCFIERVRAAVNRFPLDLYAFSLEETRKKMNADEVPVIFSDPEGILEREYAETITFDEFRKLFRKRVFGEPLA